MSEEIKYRLGAMSEKIDRLVDLNEKQSVDIKDLTISHAKISTTLEINTQELHEHKEGVIQNRSHIRALESQLKDHADQSMRNTSMIEKEIKPLLDANNEKRYVEQFVRKWGAIIMKTGGVLAAIGAIVTFLNKYL
jgi:predicted  nucleic acid-binding Zn-ribbon protein